ncbi:hypothetical protein DPMN_049101 [Dreissena polymorpha]|uniref:Uncharacterized protein n=1 Tax=Dreissena polymorpha TaxID=45954 RepID=A0A9D4I0T1_DREPO|nr:hypothetical protein DPMN_049101 [Dreissena polymorpha]
MHIVTCSFSDHASPLHWVPGPSSISALGTKSPLPPPPHPPPSHPPMPSLHEWRVCWSPFLKFTRPVNDV